jgi:hypothetical protein
MGIGRQTHRHMHPTVLLLLCVYVVAGTCLPSRCLATIGRIHIQTQRLLEGFMTYAVEMGSVATIYIPSFIKIGSGIQKLMGGGFTDTQTA